MTAAELADTTGRRRSPPSFLVALVALALVLAAAGGALVWTSLDMPAFSDPIAAQRVWSGRECEPGVPNPYPPECDPETWVRSMRGVMTNKWLYRDVGSGLVASAITFLGFSFSFYVRGEATLRGLRTPRRARSMIALLGVAWLMQLPAFWFSRQVDIARASAPPWADAQSMLTHIAYVGVVVTLLPLLLAFWLVFLYRSRLPVSVWLVIPGRPWVTAFWTLVAALPFAWFTEYIISAHAYNAARVPIGWVCLWLILCARAAALSRHLPPERTAA